MSVISVFTSQAPTIGGYEFDAVLEDTLDASVQLTGYAIESGARVMDHRIINPIKWTMTGAVSNNPLRTQITDFLGGAISNLTDNPYAATVAGLAAGFLSGSNETRSSTTLSFLINLMFTGDPFDVDTGDLQLKNMVITRISRAKDPSNENGLIFVAELQELIILDSIGSNGQPKQTQLPKDDPAQTGIAGVIDRGEKLVASVGKAVNDQVNTVLGEHILMSVEVPLENGAVNAHQKFNIQLGDNLLDFEVNYVGSYTGEPGWSMDISRDGSKLVSGAMLVPGCDVIANYNAGIGLLIFVGDDPTLDNLGTANHLCWVAE